MRRSNASHPETEPQTPCGQDCDSCGKAGGCPAALSVVAQFTPLPDTGAGQGRGTKSWK